MRIVHFAPPGFDYSSNQITEGLHLLSKESKLDYMCTNKVVHHGAQIDDLELSSEATCGTYAHNCDIILISSGGDMSYASLKLKEMHSRGLSEKIIFLDGCDSSNFLIDPSSVALYLKRELRYTFCNKLSWSNVRGFTFGVYQFHIDYESPGYDDRYYDVAFVAFGGSSPLRKQIGELLSNQLDSSFNVLVNVDDNKQPCSIDDYRSDMRDSKIIVSLQGAGWDTLRFWEAMGFGAVLCSVDLTTNLYIRDIPEANRHCLYFDNGDTLLEQIKNTVSNKVLWNNMRSASDELIRCKHTTKARAEQMIQMFKEVTS